MYVNADHQVSASGPLRKAKSDSSSDGCTMVAPRNAITTLIAISVFTTGVIRGQSCSAVSVGCQLIGFLSAAEAAA
jgi:hypothetical protein